MKSFKADFLGFCKFITSYFKSKAIFFARQFESHKNWLVDVLMFKRGLLQKRFWHSSMVGLSAFGVITSGVFGSNTIVSSTFPGVSSHDPRFGQNIEPNTNDPVLNSLFDTHTQISQKPRDKIEEYEVKSGDSVSSIAQKYGVSQDTIRWANDIDNVHNIAPSDKLKILPVSGIAHTVKSGDTLESVAKKYQAEAQAIVDFPFNDIPDDFKLNLGQVLIIPDGVLPDTPLLPKRQPQYIAQGPTFQAPFGAKFIWPSVGQFTQYFAWYHPGVDFANKTGPNVVASDGGVVSLAGWHDNYGYGNRVVIDHGNGYQTLYAHLDNIYVTAGQTVPRGQAIGRMGSTGRSTGTHLHFEIHFKGIAVNPLSILK